MDRSWNNTHDFMVYKMVLEFIKKNRKDFNKEIY
jgi:hypothetical protein